MRLSFLLALTALATVVVGPRSQACRLTADINTVPSARSSNPSSQRLDLPGHHATQEFVQCGRFAYFVASTVTHGAELWRTDGTTAGTLRVTDLAPGASSALIQGLTCLDLGAGPRLWFRATTPGNGSELYTSDGTAAGTRLVYDIRPGPSSSSPGHMVSLGNRVLFQADDGQTGAELWSSDGTAAGTRRLVDISRGSFSSNPSHLIPNPAGTTVYFCANDGPHGAELWKTNGTAIGTAMVADILGGSASADPDYLVFHNGTLLFAATGPNGRELWRSDGTVGGTTEVRDIAPGPTSSRPDLLFLGQIGSAYYFRASDPANGRELWRTDGTRAGTGLVADINPGSSSSFPTSLYVDGTRLFFTASSATGSEPYVYDGTSVTPLGDLYPGSRGSSAGNFAGIGGGRVLFSAANGRGSPANGIELWITDGTATGTRMLRDIHPGAADSNPAHLTWLPTSGKAVLVATTMASGRELWTTDGTTSGSTLLADIDPVPATGNSNPRWVFGSEPRQAIDGTSLYLSATDGSSGTELWRFANGTAFRVRDIHPGAGSSNPRGFTELWTGVRTLTVFAADDGTSGIEPWVTDGTRAGTVLLRDVQSGRSGSFPSQWTRIGQRVCFSANDGANGSELWVTDGTPAGTRLLMDIRPGALGSIPNQLFSWRGLVYFAANDGVHGTELWVSDGSFALLLADIRAGAGGSEPAGFHPFGNRLYFCADDGRLGAELWSTDGTKAGTSRAVDVNPGANGSNPDRLVACGGQLYFAAVSGAGTELHVTDGTPAGTRMLRDIYPGTSGSQPDGLTCSGRYVYFAATDETIGSGLGRELWRTDGTAAGTVLVRDLLPGSRSGAPADLLAASDGGLYFRASGPNGVEVFYTDGTSAGTREACQTRPGTPSSLPSQLTYVGNQLVFRATSPIHGTELFQLPTLPRAHTSRQGLGCAPAFGEIDSTAPVLGRSATVRGTAPARVTSVVVLGIPVGAQPVPLSNPCALHFSLQLPVLTLGPARAPTWSLPLPIPNDPGLVGGAVAAQVLYLVGVPVLARSSNAVRLVLGR